jgi:hypothetical protein
MMSSSLTDEIAIPRRPGKCRRSRTGSGKKAAAEAARYKVAQAQQRLDAAQAEVASLKDRLAQLAGAPQAYGDALAAEEQYLTHSADPRGARLLALAEERGRLTAELSEPQRARDDAEAASQR